MRGKGVNRLGKVKHTDGHTDILGVLRERDQAESGVVWCGGVGQTLRAHMHTST